MRLPIQKETMTDDQISKKMIELPKMSSFHASTSLIARSLLVRARSHLVVMHAWMPHIIGLDLVLELCKARCLTLRLAN